ncbi:MAG: carbohydrate kinase [Bacteroidales bacterium]|nr:carbohydrate kinase [Bacteroidales bacterium]
MIFLGLDIGSSSIKASLFDAGEGVSLGWVNYPEKEMEILAPKNGWAEQDPEVWFEHVISAILLLKEECVTSLKDVKAIGISYQMHGLVILDTSGSPIRNAIIWCDSRAVDIGNKAFENIGRDFCVNNLLNSPGNFTASKLNWIQKFEPENYTRIHKIMLPGDYIAYRLTGEINTTESGLSEGVFWNFSNNNVSDKLIEYYNIDPQLLPDVVPVFSKQGFLKRDIASQLGLTSNIPVAYRAGDQLNNAFSLRVLNPGDVAATAGTSGVVYCVTDQQKPDPLSRVNTFLHVNNTKEVPRHGVLLCINGTGIMNSWIKHNIMPGNLGYTNMNELASSVPPGSDGLMVFPFGNGAERVLENKDIKSRIIGLDFNKHSRAHLLRASQEGIVFAMIYGLEIMKELGLKIGCIRASFANMFLSPVFRNTFGSLSGADIEIFNTDGAQGAARGAAVGIRYYKDINEAFESLEMIEKIFPEKNEQLELSYNKWKQALNKVLTDY